MRNSRSASRSPTLPEVRRSIEAAADEVVDVHFVAFWPWRSTRPLRCSIRFGFQGISKWISSRAVVLQIDAFGCGIGGEQDAHGGFLRVGLEGRLDRFALIVGHAAVDHLQPAFFGKAFAGQQVE